MKRSESEIGVLVPVYNAESTVEECLASLSAQTLGDFSALLVDDGSTDAVPAILARWARRDPRFHVLSRRHEGLVAALNAGLAALPCPLIARMDADDIARPDRLERQRDAFREHPEATLIASRYDLLGDGLTGEGNVTYQRWQNALLTNEQIRANLFVESPFAHPTVMFRRDAVLAAGGYRDMGWPEDYDLWLRLARAGAVFEKIPEALVLWRDRPDRLTWTDPRYSIEAFTRCKAHHLARGPLRGRGPILIGGAGIAGGRISRALLSEGVEIAAFLDVDPHKIGGTKRDRPVTSWEDGLARYPGLFLVVAVGARGARDQVRAFLDARGYRETADYLCAA